MALSAATGLSNIGTGTTPIALAFGWNPLIVGAALKVAWSGRTSNGVARGNIQMGVGIAGCQSGAASGVFSVSGASTDTGTSACESGLRDDCIIHAINASGTEQGIADITWTSTGCTITPRTSHTFTNDLVFHWEALPTEATAVMSPNEPATATTSSITGIAWAPTAGFQIAMGNVSSFSSPSQTATDLNISVGAFIKTTGGTIRNAVFAIGSDNGQATTATRIYWRIGDCMARYGSTLSTTLLARSSVTAFNNDGVTFTYNTVEGSGNHAFPTLLIRNGNFEILQFTSLTNTTTDIVLTPGFPTLGLLAFMSMNNAQNTAGTASNGAAFGLGMSTGSTSDDHSSSARDSNAVAGATVTNASDNANSIYSLANGAVSAAAHVTAKSSTTVTWRMTTQEPSSSRLGWVFFFGLNDGAIAVTQADAAFAGAAASDNESVIAVTQDDSTFAAIATEGGATSNDSTIAVTQEDATFAGVAASDNRSTIAVTQSDASLAGAVASDNQSTVSVTQDDAVFAAAASGSFDSTIAVTLADSSFAAVAASDNQSVIAVTQADSTFVGSMSSGQDATIAATQADAAIAVTAASTNVITSIAITQADATISAVAGIDEFSTIAVTMADAIFFASVTNGSAPSPRLYGPFP